MLVCAALEPQPFVPAGDASSEGGIIMRLKLRLIAAGLCAAGAGCGSFWENTRRNVAEAPVFGIDQCRISKRNQRLANEAWEAIARGQPRRAFSPDYACGFKAGYADYLESGGNGQPPAVPPFHYRLSKYQTPEGYQAIETWYAGFRDGSAAARASGLRQVFVLPLSAPPVNALVRNPDAPAEPVLPAEVPTPGSRELPAPRPADPNSPQEEAVPQTQPQPPE